MEKSCGKNSGYKSSGTGKSGPVRAARAPVIAARAPVIEARAPVIAAPVRAALMSPTATTGPAPSVTLGHQGGPVSAVAREFLKRMTVTKSPALNFSIKKMNEDPKFIKQYKNVEDLKNIDTETLNDELTIYKNKIENYSETEIQDLIKDVVRKTISEMEARKTDELEKQKQTTSEEMFKTIASNLKQLLSEVKTGQGKSYADFAENINYMTKNPLIIFRAMLFLATICLIVYNKINNRKSESSPQETRNLLNKEAFTTTLNIFKTDSQQYV
jgi:hypothetical protein